MSDLPPAHRRDAARVRLSVKLPCEGLHGDEAQTYSKKKKKTCLLSLLQYTTKKISTRNMSWYIPICKPRQEKRTRTHTQLICLTLLSLFIVLECRS